MLPSDLQKPLLQFDSQQSLLTGPSGSLLVPKDDEVTRKLLMLIEAECLGLGPLQAAAKFGFSKQRYFQVRQSFADGGAGALASRKPGPKGRSRRTREVIRQVIRHRFLDPDATADVIAQRLRQSGLSISTRSVERIIAHFGLQKKTLPLPAGR
jgi:hypothetical protein